MNKELLEIIAIDESGITSLKGYSVYAFVFISVRDYVSISQYIINIEKELKVNYIHRHEMTWDLRTILAKRLAILNFKIEGIVHKNPINPSKVFESSLVLKISEINHAYRIFVDGHQSKRYEEKIKKALKKHGLQNYRLKFVNDLSEPIVRLADFMAGSLRSHLNNPENSKSEIIYKILESKVRFIHKTK